MTGGDRKKWVYPAFQSLWPPTEYPSWSLASWIKRAPYPKNWEKTPVGKKLIAGWKSNPMIAVPEGETSTYSPGVQPTVQFKNGIETKPKFKKSFHPITGSFPQVVNESTERTVEEKLQILREMPDCSQTVNEKSTDEIMREMMRVGDRLKEEGVDIMETDFSDERLAPLREQSMAFFTKLMMMPGSGFQTS